MMTSVPQPSKDMKSQSEEWLKTFLTTVFLEYLDTSSDTATDKFNKHVLVATRTILSVIDEAVTAELNTLKTKKVKGAELVEIKWVDDRIDALRKETK